MPISDLADPESCQVYLWTTHRFLPAAFDIFEGCGVAYHCLLTSVKPTRMTPFSWMLNTARPLRVRRTPRYGEDGAEGIVRGAGGEHSQKPEIYELIERMFAGRKYLELSSRNSDPREGLLVWGNELEVA